MHHSIRRVLREDTFVFLTDNAVGKNEEENLFHLQSNLAQDSAPERLIPFLTCKHSLEYCLMYADRALSQGYQALTVLGGDRDVGTPRCLDHAYALRQRIRDVKQQVDFLEDGGFTGEFFLTQVVSHFDLPRVEAFLTELRQRELPLTPLFGVFYYRSARAKTLQRLANFIPVPIDGLSKAFEAGATPVELCARTIKSLRDLGADSVYVSNIEFRKAPLRLREIRERVEG